ncbi:hypothetical protein [Streptomyces sp. NBC_01465]|nr:hypothetical protein [Streptomyces sp. NBC_01465]
MPPVVGVPAQQPQSAPTLGVEGGAGSRNWTPSNSAQNMASYSYTRT